MKVQRKLLFGGGLLLAVLSTGCAVSGASVEKSINDYYFPDKAAKDARSSPKSEAALDTIPNASEIKELNQ